MQEKVAYPIRKSNAGFNLEKLVLTTGGIMSLTGWVEDSQNNLLSRLTLFQNDSALEPIEIYHRFRSDVKQARSEVVSNFQGFGIDYLIREQPRKAVFSVKLDGMVLWKTKVDEEVQNPDYSHFFFDKNIKKKTDVYGYGPPDPSLNPEVAALTDEFLKEGDQVLDFGCGTGTLVMHLRNQGIQAQGLDLDTLESQAAVHEEAGPFVEFYNSEMPLPYLDNQFDAVIATEVLEHVEQAEAAIREISRISKRVFIMTVPDATGIPRCHSQGVIPWHLLEDTHVNFFTQSNLIPVLENNWVKVMPYKIGFSELPRTFFSNNLACVCMEPKH